MVSRLGLLQGRCAARAKAADVLHTRLRQQLLHDKAMTVPGGKQAGKHTAGSFVTLQSSGAVMHWGLTHTAVLLSCHTAKRRNVPHCTLSIITTNKK